MSEKKIPMTPLQRSYKNGLQAAYGTETKELYLYSIPEDKPLNEDILNETAEKLVQAHPFLCYGAEQNSYELVYGAGIYHIGHVCTDNINEFAENLFNEPLKYVFEFWLIQNGNKKILAVKTDGMYFDANSLDIFSSEIQTLLSGGTLDYEDSFLTYAKNYSELKNEILTNEEKEYWKEISSVKAPGLPISENVVDDIKTAVIRQSVTENVYNSLADVAAECNVTLFALLLTIFGKSVSLYSTEKEFMLTLPMSDRNIGDNVVKENSIGLFADAMLFRFYDEGKSIAETADDVQYNIMETFDFSRRPINEIYQYIRSTGESRFSAPVSFTDISSSSVPQSKMKRISTRVQTSQLWIEAIFQKCGTNYELNLTYQTNIVPEFVASGITEIFCHTLESIAENSKKMLKNSSLDLRASDIELIENLNNTGEPACDCSLYELLASAFQKYESRSALISLSRTLSYAELWQKALSVGETVRKFLGNYKDKLRVGIMLPKSDRQIIAGLGCILSGITYMPIENELTAETIAAIVRNAKLSGVITDNSLADKLSGSDIVNIPYDENTEIKNEASYPVLSEDDVAVIINTSGTTGIPKSVLIKSAGIANCLCYTEKLFGLNKNDKVLALTNFCHDMALFDTFGLLICGGAAVIPENNLQKDPAHWCELMDRFGVTVWNSVPVFLEMYTAHCDSVGIIENTNIRCIDLGGDWIRPSFAEKVLKMFPNAKFFSVGGPTETTIWNISHCVTFENCKLPSIPYGRPFPATKYYIINDRHALCPVGISGTMYVSGIGVSAGYAGNADDSEKRFTEYEGCRYYNTGDNGMYSPDGTVRILGRSDFQIKIHGKRIELVGIENAAMSCTGVKGAVCVLNKVIGKLVLFVTSDEKINEVSLRNMLAKKLPEYMLPSDIVSVNKFPVTRNGKIDRKALENAEISNNKSVSNGIGKIDKVTQKLLQICKETLINFQYDDSLNFYIMGGDSLSSLEILKKIREEFGVDLSITEMMMYPSLNEWTEIIKERSCSADKTSEFLDSLCDELFGKSAEDGICLFETDDPQANAVKAAEKISSFTGTEINVYRLLAYPFIRDWAAIISGGI